jgi:hypothetical protein
MAQMRVRFSFGRSGTASNDRFANIVYNFICYRDCFWFPVSVRKVSSEESDVLIRGRLLGSLTGSILRDLGYRALLH